MNLPNILSLTRVLLIPLFVIFIMDHLYCWALITFAVAGITDGVDGLLARLTHQRTELGAYLDPIADKLLLSAAFVSLAILEILPSWLTVVVITRDVIIILGFCVLLLTGHRPQVRPSLVSKITTDFQIATVILALLNFLHAFFQALSMVAIIGTTLLTIVSGAHYIYLGALMLNEKKV